MPAASSSNVMAFRSPGQAVARVHARELHDGPAGPAPRAPTRAVASSSNVIRVSRPLSRAERVAPRGSTMEPKVTATRTTFACGRLFNVISGSRHWSPGIGSRHGPPRVRVRSRIESRPSSTRDGDQRQAQEVHLVLTPAIEHDVRRQDDVRSAARYPTLKPSPHHVAGHAGRDRRMNARRIFPRGHPVIAHRSVRRAIGLGGTSTSWPPPTCCSSRSCGLVIASGKARGPILVGSAGDRMRSRARRRRPRTNLLWRRRSGPLPMRSSMREREASA